MRGTPAASPGLTINAGPLTGGGKLLRDYQAGLHLESFYSGHPGDIEAYRRKAAEVDARMNAEQRRAVADALEPLGDAAGRLRRILDGDGYFVTTGQQPALFGGPLYTLYKVLAAIRLAAWLEAQLGKPCVALFWIGADDHDWEEANHTAVIGVGDYVHRLQVTASADLPPVPMSDRTWGNGVASTVEDLLALLPDTDSGRAVAAHVRNAYQPDSTVEASFTATMKWLLHERRVVLVSSADPQLRRAAAPVLLHDAGHIRDHAEAIAWQTARLEDAGYRAQVALAADASNIMLADERGRDRLIRTRAGWLTRRDRQALGDGALKELLQAQPEQFSPNVFLRPVVENAVFPTIAYVAGPAEVSYFAQIGCLFTAHDILPPVVVPRCSVTLIEPGIQRVLGRLGLEPQAFAQPLDQLMTQLARSSMPAAVRNALERTRAALLQEYEELAAAAADVDPALRGPVRSARNAALQRLHHAEKKIVRQIQRSDEVRAEQLRRVSAQLQPNGTPQERALTPLHFAARYGRGIVAAIEAALDVPPARVAQWNGLQCRRRGSVLATGPEGTTP